MRGCRFPYYDRHRQAPHRDTDKQAARIFADMQTLLLIPFSTVTSGPEPRLSNKIGGFVVKGNPKIHVQYFNSWPSANRYKCSTLPLKYKDPDCKISSNFYHPQKNHASNVV